MGVHRLMMTMQQIQIIASIYSTAAIAFIYDKSSLIGRVHEINRWSKKNSFKEFTTLVIFRGALLRTSASSKEPNVTAFLGVGNSGTP